MFTLIIYDTILILQNYGISEIPCSIPLFRIGLPNRFSVTVVSVSIRLIFRCLLTVEKEI